MVMLLLDAKPPGRACLITSVFLTLTVSPKRAAAWAKQCVIAWASSRQCTARAQSSAYNRSRASSSITFDVEFSRCRLKMPSSMRYCMLLQLRNASRSMGEYNRMNSAILNWKRIRESDDALCETVMEWPDYRPIYDLRAPLDSQVCRIITAGLHGQRYWMPWNTKLSIQKPTSYMYANNKNRRIPYIAN